MEGLRNKILCGVAGASGGLSGILSLSGCSGAACTSCFGCLGVGVGLMLVALFNRGPWRIAKEGPNKRGEASGMA